MLKIIFLINFAFAGIEPLKVRVRIAKSVPVIRISGTDLKNVIFSKNLESSYQGKKTIQFNCLKSQYISKPTLFASLSSNVGLLEFNDHKYQGKVLIVSKAKDRSCDVVNETTMESYIGTLLAKEMNAVWPIEALKAQAVAARTYAYSKMKSKNVSVSAGYETFYDLESSERHQVGGQFFDANQNTVRAANATKGEILITEAGKVTPIFFHAKCGGRTLRPDQVWENVVPGYNSVICPFCENHGKSEWRSTVNNERFRSFLNFLQQKKHIPKITDADGNLFIPFSEELKPQVRVYVGEKFYTFNKSLFRNYFGRILVPSNYFKIVHQSNKIELTGKGLGHGVGMCQLGCLDMAQKGYDYKTILAHYFPNHRLEKIY
jgi:stage II sporulation protein D